MIRFFCVLLGVLALANSSWAHALEPGFLDIRETSEGVVTIGWKVPQISGKPMLIEAVLPDTCTVQRPPGDLAMVNGAFTATWSTRCEGGLEGRPILIEGLEATSTDVLVRYQSVEGITQTLRLTPSTPSAALLDDPGFWGIMKTYFLLGVDHILFGFDHILFVLALLLLVKGGWRIVKTITAFTIAHSLTLSAAALGYVFIPVPPVEAVIALSILFLAIEILRSKRGQPSLTERKPWIVAFLFGLLHGLGFASALSETGLPQNDIPVALLTFNLGVEAGQLLFITAALLVIALLHRLVAGMKQRDRLSDMALTGTTYAIGSLASFWLIERVSGFFT